MYFPYLRGKQFELIALRELKSVLEKNRKKASPVIEPVKDSSTFEKTLSDLKDTGINFSVIINPQKGDLIKSSLEIIETVKKKLAGYTNFQLAVIFEGNQNHDDLISLIKSSNIDCDGLTIIHNKIIDRVESLLKRYDEIHPVKFNIINFRKTNNRYHRNFKNETRVELDDFFIAQGKNSDYSGIEDSQFSEEHLHYLEEGFVGFSDFLTIGDIYMESGALPFAVAIHLSYADKEKRIRIKHFVSDTNEDRTDTAGKFAEALEKLISWCNKNEIK